MASIRGTAPAMPGIIRARILSWHILRANVGAAIGAGRQPLFRAWSRVMMADVLPQRWRPCDVGGGVLEHPEASAAWSAFGLNSPPLCGGWVMADWQGGWTCCVEQGQYGHRARKATWLYATGVDLPSLRWGAAPGDFVRLDEGFHSIEERRRAVKTGACQRLSQKQRASTPVEFRDLLISIASSVNLSAANCTQPISTAAAQVPITS